MIHSLNEYENFAFLLDAVQDPKQSGDIPTGGTSITESI